ncbi:MAG: ComEC/Rec2 family competence protein [Endomicrobium sp.]|nr:ComEC/Rec2 family competence protein [Endomicrobium sp.]
MLSITIAVQLVLIPIYIYYFGKISIISFLTNIIIVPFSGIILYLGVSFYALTFIFKYMVVLISLLLSIILNFVLSVTNILGNFKYATISLEKPTIIELLFYFFFLFCLINLKSKKRVVIIGLILTSNMVYLIIRNLKI